jgi:zinc protease
MRFIFFLLYIVTSLAAFANTTQQFTLNNGLKVLVKEDKRAPIAVVMIWYQVGSADDPSGKTGISHVLEHLMFKGTKAYPMGVFSKTIASIGGQENAFTSTDYTAYFEKIAATHVPLALKLEADRMQNLILDASEFSKEMKVIQEERRMRTEDNPQALTFERFLAAAHLTTPYHQPVIGWMNDLKNLKIEDVRDWYRRHYAPNHATLIVIGDVHAKEIQAYAQQYFGHLEKRPTAKFKPQHEPPALGQKTVEVHTRAQVPFLLRGYTVPSVKSTSTENALAPYTLEVIAALLDAGESSRFQQHLVRKKQCASATGVQYNLYTRYDTQFMIYAAPSQQCTMEQLKVAIQEEMTRLQKELVQNDELQRVKTQLIAEKTFERDSIFSQAMELGILESIGLPWKISNDYKDNIQRVTPEMIQRTASLYFQAENQTDAHLNPKEIKS